MLANDRDHNDSNPHDIKQSRVRNDISVASWQRQAKEMHKAGIGFRDYRPGDFPTLCDIDRLCFPAGVAYSPAEMSYWLRSRDAFAVIAEAPAEDPQGSCIAGFVLGRRERDGKGHIITIEVLPEYRRAGIATELLERAEQRFKQMMVTRVELFTWVENTQAVAFYHKLGYQTVGRIPRYYLGRLDAWLMAREV